jgi:cytochrome P450
MSNGTEPDLPTRRFHRTPSPPGPKGNLITGNAHGFFTDRLGTLTRGRQEFGDVVSYRIGPIRGVVVSRPELIEQVLVHQAKSFKKDLMSHMLHPATGDGIFLCEGESCSRRRRMVSPTFHQQKIALYAEVMDSYLQTMSDKWSEGGERDVVPDIMEMALGVAAKTLFSVDIDTEEGRTVAAAMTEVMNAVARRIASPLPLPEFVPTPLMLRLKRGVAQLDKFVYQFIEDRRTGKSSADDLLSLLLDARDDETDGTGMTDRQVRDEAMTIFMAGFETTSLSLAWVCHLLAAHPEVQSLLRSEVIDALGDRRLTAADYRQLSYAECVVNETLRLYPPVAMIGREALVDLELGGFRIRKGTAVWPTPWIAHRDPQLWDRPLEFLPERWTSESRAQLPKYSFFPFGGGPHNCVGRMYAMMEMVLGIATIIRKFELEPVPGKEPRPFPGYTVRPDPGVTVKLIPRSSVHHLN